MVQTTLRVVSWDYTDRTVTLAFPNGKRVEYFLSGAYERIVRALPNWIDNGWYNHAVSKITEVSTAIYVDGIRQPESFKETIMSADYKNVPSEEYSFTVIATTARSVTYNGGRKWFKTQEDATEFAGEVYEGEAKQNFELAIVQCVDVVRPKPKTMLMSTFKRSEPKTLGATTNALSNDLEANG